MPSFTYQARDRQGVSHAGTLEAVDASALADALRQRGWLVLDVTASNSGGGKADGGGAARLNPAYWLPVRSLDVEVSLQQIATMLRSGLTLLTSLDTVTRQAERRAVTRVWRDVSLRVQEGSSLADAMAAHRCFSRLVIQLVRVGEQTGTLDAVLARAAETLEARRNLRTNLVTAMIYPVIVVVMAVAVTAFMMIEVIPKVERAFRSFNRKLPQMTQILVDVSAWIGTYLPVILVVTGLTVASLIAVYFWPPGRLVMDRWFLRIPLIGRLLRLAGTAAFSQTLGTMIRSGVTVLEGLRTTEDLHHNRHLAQRVALARQRVLEGGSLAEPLSARYAYMPMLAGMVAVGESSGRLDDTLDELAQFHEKQLQSAIKRFSAIIEPVIIVVVGGIVGFVYISFFLALFSFAGGVG